MTKFSTLRESVHPGKVLLPLGLGTSLSLFGDITLYTVLPTHTMEAGITLGGVGIILSANRIIRLFTNAPTGYLYDRLEKKRLFVLSLFIGALSTAVYAATHGFWPLLVGRLLWGLAWSGIWVGGSTIILDVTGDQDRGRWTGLYQTWFFLGSAAGAFLGGLLTDWTGYKTTMWIGALLTALGGSAALCLLPRVKDPNRAYHSSSYNVTLSQRYNQRGIWIASFLFGINRFVIAGVLVSTAALLVQGQLTSASLPFGAASITGILLAGRTLVSTLSAPLAGSLSDRLGNRWTVIISGLILGAIGMLMVGMNPFELIFIGMLLGAVAGGSLQALLTATVGDMVGLSQRGRAISLLHTSGDLGSALGPPVAYALLPWIGLPLVYLICASLFAIGMVFVLWYRLSKRKLGSLV